MRHAATPSVSAVLCFVLCGVCWAAKPADRWVVCPKAAGAIVINGRADDAPWANAAQIGPLLTLRKMTAPPNDCTMVKLLYDDTSLYLAITCKAAPAGRGKKLARDDRGLWQTDHIEIFLNAFPAERDYYHLAVDRWGNVGDAWKTEKDAAKKGIAWHGKWRAATAQNREGWTAEVALPYDTFGARVVTPGDWWRFKIGRDAGRDGPLMWPPNPLTGFHRRSVDAALYFDKRSIAADGAGASGNVQQTPAPPLTGPDYTPDPDPVQGLESLSERAGHKPWDRYWRKDHLLTYRVIFRDRTYGTWLWMIDNSPSVQSMYTASRWCPWNSDGTVLLVMGPRRTPERTRSTWYCNADFSRLNVWPGGIPMWDLADPDGYYTHRTKTRRVRKMSIRRGELQVLASWPPHLSEKAYGLTGDNRRVFVQDHDGGLWVPYTPGEKPLPRVRVYDGWSVALHDRTRVYGKASAENPSLNSFATYDKKYGHLFRILIGTCVSTEDGHTERVIVPFSGHNEYLKTFASGRVQFPKDAKPPMTRDLEELFKIFQLFPQTHHGHKSFSPDRKYVCWDGAGLFGSHRVRDLGDRRYPIRSVSPDGEVYHVCWLYDPRFYVTHVRGDTKDYARTVNSNLLCQVFSDGTWQPLADTKARVVSQTIRYTVNAYPSFSRDATKVHYGSNMTGAARTYIAVMARPQPPRELAWQPEGDAVVLRWGAPPHHAEIRGYLVYRSERSGDGYELLTPEAVSATTYRDATVRRGCAYYYVVSSLEPGELESGYSAEAARAGVGLAAGIRDPLVVYAEVENSLVDLKTGDTPGVSRGRDVAGASNWYYVYRSPGAERSIAALGVRIPAAADYFLWVRVRRGKGPVAQWRVGAGGRLVGAATCSGQTWQWVRTGPAAVRLEAGARTLTLSTGDAAAQADLVCLTTDPKFTPAGVRPEDRSPPAPVQGLTVVKISGRTVQIKWQANGEPDFFHYNVYAARGPLAGPQQKHLVASPTYGEFLDWGLRAGVTYHYAVTAVDRRGNESGVSAMVKATIPARPYEPQEIELRFDQAKLRGDLKRATAQGTRGKEYVLLPSDVTAKQADDAGVSWRINLKHDGKYYFWLRYLPLKPLVKQHLEVLLDDRPVTTLGGGETGLHASEGGLPSEFWQWAGRRFWTWAKPVDVDLIGVDLPAGKHTLTIRKLARSVRYDVLFITDEPSFVPGDGRLRQARYR